MLRKLFATCCVVGCFIAVTLPFNSCKKDVPPTLLLTVTDSSNNIVADAEVRVWYGTDANQGATNDEDYDQSGKTDANGQVQFEFPYSAILDIHAFSVQATPNPPFPDIIDTLWGTTAVKVKTKRQRKKDNIEEETIIIQ